ncbi:MAG: hypothetical protein HQK53_16755, partial [Oligoflexia bacterium]|nr:hypothetical protein [Oligoflexia bacterium]
MDFFCKLNKKVSFIISLTIVTFVILFFSIGNQSHAQSANSITSKIKIVVGEWAPYVSEKMADYGFSAKITSAALQAANLEFEYIFYPWKRALTMVEEGEAWGTVPFFRTAEREKIYYYSDELSSSASKY